MAEDKPKIPTFSDYAARWQKEHVDTNCKLSSAIKHEQVLRLYLLPKFSSKPLDEIRRGDLKELLADLLAGKKPERSTPNDRDIIRQYRREIVAGTFNADAARADVEAEKLKAGELQDAATREPQSLTKQHQACSRHGA